MIARRLLALAMILLPLAAHGQVPTLVETPIFAKLVAAGSLPPVARRLPAVPLVVDLSGDGLAPGRHGGSLDLLMGRAKDVRQMVVYGYARLVGYDKNLNIVPDLIERLEVKEGRVFTFHLRKGHKWSDGHPFTTEDFRYWWEDVANDPKLAKLGPPRIMLVDGEKPVFEVIDEVTVRYSWTNPNPFFLPRLAGASPLYIYKPAHYLKQFHAKYADPEKLAKLVKKSRRRNWIVLHFRKDRAYKNDNRDLPTLQPWMLTTKPPANRFVFKRNPYYHRIDKNGRQLPYIDRVNINVVSSKLIAPKAGAGEADLQSRNLNFGNYTALKESEKRNGYRVRLWGAAKGSHMALYPNLNNKDPEWRKLFRDVRFRRALSMATNRHEINQVIYYGLANEANNTVLSKSPLYKKEYAKRWTQFDLRAANRLLDEIGLTKRNKRGIRLLPDGRPMEVTVETAGESTEQTDVLQLITDSWLKVGIKMFPKGLQREVLRNRIFAGATKISVWFGLENGVPTADISPRELAPTSQQQLQWPKWGQYYETNGKAGEAVDMPGPKELARLNQRWARSGDGAERERIWHRMLDIYTDNVFSIGLISEVPQPIVVNAQLRNVPEKAIYNWDPGAHFGIYKPDTFWFADGKKRLN